MKPIIRKPYPNEASAIKRLMAVHAESGLLLQRDEEEIREAIKTFLIAELDKKIIGSVSGYGYDSGLFEIRSLVVAEEYGGYGVGSVLLKRLIAELKEKKARKIFALSYSPEFFRKNGFHDVPKETLPEKIWKDCVFCKNRDNCGETALVYLD